MKVLMVALLVLGVALAEPAFRRQQAQQAKPQDTSPQDDVNQDAEDAPYAPSGWKPAGQRLELPNKQYGAPSRAQDHDDDTTETPTEATPAEPKAPKAAKQAPASRSEKQQAEPQYEGEYYVILPDGRLQRVQFAAKLEASPSDKQQQDQDQDEEAAEESSQEAAAGPRPGSRPAAPRPRPQPAAQQQAMTPAVSAGPQYLVILPDGRYQQVQYYGKLEASAAEQPRPPRPSRPAAGRPQSRQQPMALVPQVEAQAEAMQQAQQASAPSSFVAELRFMEVPPITGPVFSYSGPLVRVQREI